MLNSSYTTAGKNSSAVMAVHARNNKPKSVLTRGGRFELPNCSYGSKSFRSNCPFALQEKHCFDQEKCHSESGKQRPHCTYCGDIRHWIQTCYQLHGYSPSHTNASSKFLHKDKQCSLHLYCYLVAKRRIQLRKDLYL